VRARASESAASATDPPAEGYRGRLAPSPTGALHLGNARTFLAAWLRARQSRGAVILRVEDIDGPRVKPGASEALLEDLRWLGLDWDEGPDVGGPFAPYVQTERRSRYEEAIRSLLARGLAYACICTRKEVEGAASAPHGPEGARYPGTCRGRFPGGPEEAARASGRPAAVRLLVAPGEVAFEDAFAGPRAFDVSLETGDFVVGKGTGDAAYQLAVVLDDAAMDVREVVRGDDLLPSTARQLLLYRALGLEARIPRFCHLPLVVGPDGRRLAKRHGDSTIARYRRAGVRAERIVALLARWLGIEAGDAATPRGLVGALDLARVPRGPLLFDPATLPA
jgi:glutamyl-tRNA synthetase